jgi:acetoacetyl-CoA synthetase
LNDINNKRYRSAYFEHYGDKIWYHGDFITIQSSGGVIVHGRSDATLNPGGIRIGTAEVYRQVEQLNFIQDSLCVGKNENGDVSITLFVKMKNINEKLNEDQTKLIKKLIKSKTTPRHVPKYIISVSDIPYTRSGKKMELAVNRIINGREITNIEAVANPECLEQYEKAFN